MLIHRNNSIKLSKRTTDNNTHSNIVDDSIKQVVTYKIAGGKCFFAVLLYFFTLGILYIIAKLNKKLYLKLHCQPSNIKDADYIVIVDKDKNYHLLDVIRESFYRKNYLLTYIYSFDTKNKSIKEIMEDSHYKGDDYNTSKDTVIVVYYRHNKYYLNEIDNSLVPIVFDLTSHTTEEIHNTYGRGLSDMFDYNYLLNKFGKNVIELKAKSFVILLFEQIFHPFYIYQIVSIVIWCKTGYFYFMTIVIVLLLVTLIINTTQKLDTYKNMLIFTSNTYSKIIRHFQDKDSNYDLSHKSNLSINK